MPLKIKVLINIDNFDISTSFSSDNTITKLANELFNDV